MLKYQQKQILELIQTLDEATSEIKRLFAQKDISAVLQLFDDCQECAIQIRNFIESIEGVGTKTASMLEEYCEALYQAGAEAETISKNFTKRLNKHLILITNSVKNELAPNQIEIVFLPYKASMWDSFESVYLAAKADPNCHAYCIPIPYFNKCPDGSFDKFHYEGDLYPDSVEITDWQAYDIEKRHPDIIFIHNPYDDRNIVTSVHPQYYTDKLKDHTNLLVYIDYGLNLWMPKIPFVNTLKAQSFFPLVNNVDLFITYSDEQRQQNQVAFRTFVKNKKELDKFVTLGSPKFDKVLHTSRKEFTLPEEWEKILRTPASAYKKVILYNNSIGAILENCEEFFEQFLKMIEIFKHRDDVVLWWRPHPLAFETIKSMRPEYIGKYEQIMRYYNSESIGIYDDSTDLHRAIAWSDAYYGHESSVVFLYLATGKPFSIIKVKKPLSKPKYRYLKNCKTDSGNDFTAILKQRIKNMQAAKGANALNGNCCIWWHNFLEDDLVGNIHYANFLGRFIHYVTHMEEYPSAELYRQLCSQMFSDFIENSNGTAGRNIYEYCKRKIWNGDKW